jgi:hypothetical protein
MEYKYIRIADDIQIPVPLAATPEQEAVILERARAALPQMVAEHAELKEAMRHPEQWCSFDELMKELGIDSPPQAGEVA